MFVIFYAQEMVGNQRVATFLLVILLVLAPYLSSATVYYVKPTEPHSIPCPVNPCYTLEEYADNATQFFHSVSNVAVILLPGIHILNQNLGVIRVSNFTFMGYSGPTNGVRGISVNITCGMSCGFAFRDSADVKIEKVALIQGSVTFAYVSNLTMTQVVAISAQISAYYSINMQLFEVIVDGGGILTHYVTGNSSIERTQVKNTGVRGFDFYADSILEGPSHLTVKNCIFQNYTGVSGLIGGFIYIRMSPSPYAIQIDIEHTTITGGGVTLYITAETPDLATVAFRECYIGESSSTGITIYISGDGPQYTASGRVFIQDCEIVGHLNGGLHFFFRYRHTEVVIQNSVIRHNVFDPLSGTLDIQYPFAAGLSLGIFLDFFQTPDFCHPNSVVLYNVTFERNDYIGVLGPLSAIVALYNARHCVTLIDCQLNENTGTPIFASSSTFNISGKLSFVNNIAYQGGAMTFVGYPPEKTSFMSLQENAHVYFQGNHASQGGGAIFVAETTRLSGFFDSGDLLLPCFYSAQRNVSLMFFNNTADDGGNAIYGPFQTLSSCNYSSLYFEDNGNSNFSLITSNPSRVCVCENGNRDCTTVIVSEVEYMYPGGTLNLPVVVVGETFGTVTGSVYAHFLPSRHTVAIGELQQSQAVGHDSCTTLKYTIYSDNDKDVLVLTTSEVAVNGFPNRTEVNITVAKYENDGTIAKDLLSFPLYINITFLPCPLGFILSGHPAECVCDTQLQQNNVTCNINDQTIHRSGALWVNAFMTGNTSNGVLLHRYCPFHYCKEEEVAVNLNNPETQCAFEHSGILCGACQPGLSLTIGSTQCLSCSNTFLVLLIPFAIAGLVLVAFIKFLDLTVSKGTINGLIFYANIIGGTRTLWFPAGDTNILTVFIAWVNLDLGIETCFFDGLNGYWKMWLQFVFPIYIWTIAGLIILTSYYSIRAAKIFGNNSVPVLATLILISYTKLLRTIITALSFAILEYPDGSNVVVWAFDGNIKYLGPAHIPLFLAAVAVLVFLFLPFTLILLFGQCLQRTSFRWVHKMKPVFDAYFGPFENHHRYWVGVLLLVRCVLLLIFSLTVVNAPNVNLLVVGTTALLLLQYSSMNTSRRVEARRDQQGLAWQASQVTGSCYEKWYLSLLENSFIFNLGVLALGTLYIGVDGGKQAVLAYISVGVVFVQFIGIVLFHAVQKVKTLVQRRVPNKEVVRENNLHRGVNVAPPGQISDSIRLRESLLN